MGLLRYGIILGCTALLINFIANRFHSKLPPRFDGFVEKGFESVRKAFEQNFRDGWESEGASFAVFVNGHKLVDLWGGYANKQATRPWKKETISPTFSIIKSVLAVCIAILVDRGRLKYDDLVSKHWLGFAKNGKGNITVEWVLSHMAGLPYLDSQISEEMAADHNLMRKLLEKEAPNRSPGHGTAYHAFTYGWLVDQIVRHTDEKRRGIAQFLREELTEPNGIDFHICLNATEEHRVGRATLASISELIAEVWHEPRVALMLLNFYSHLAFKNSVISKAMANPPWKDVHGRCTINSPEQQALEVAAAMGFGNARSLASIFNLLVSGRIVGEGTLALLRKPVVNATDHVLNSHTVKGHGFFYHPSPFDYEKDFMIGHSGHGCQQVMFDTKNKIAFAYVTNGLKLGIYDLCRNYIRLQTDTRS